VKKIPLIELTYIIIKILINIFEYINYTFTFKMNNLNYDIIYL